MDLNAGMEDIDPAECMALLATEQLGRLAVVVDGRPEIFPVNFAVDGGGIIFRTGQGTKLRGAISSPVVFEVDHFDPGSGSAWSVILHGRADQVNEQNSAALRQRISQLSLYPWHGGEKPHVVRLTLSEVAGRRIPGRRAKSSPALVAVAPQEG